MKSIEDVKKKCKYRDGNCVENNFNGSADNKSVCDFLNIYIIPNMCPFIEYKGVEYIKPCNDKWSGMSYIRWMSETGEKCD